MWGDAILSLSNFYAVQGLCSLCLPKVLSGQPVAWEIPNETKEAVVALYPEL